MLDWLFGKMAAKFWQRRVRSWHPKDSEFAREWERINPGLCLYCSYTRWANHDKSQNLKIGRHECKEGNSPPGPLPRAKVIRK